MRGMGRRDRVWWGRSRDLCCAAALAYCVCVECVKRFGHMHIAGVFLDALVK